MLFGSFSGSSLELVHKSFSVVLSDAVAEAALVEMFSGAFSGESSELGAELLYSGLSSGSLFESFLKLL